MAIRDWPAAERPREKLLLQGPGALSDAELLAIFLRTGLPGMSAVDLARELVGRFGGLRDLLGASETDFCAAPGLGRAKYAQLQAVLEMGRRYLDEELRRPETFTGPAAVRRFLTSRLRHRQREVFALLLLDNQHRLIAYEEPFKGTLDCASVYPREVVRRVLAHNAAAVILAHNHPSGVAEPSAADRQITERLISALALVEVRVLDHLVVGEGPPVSFAERGWL
ncbi:DNA repair protein RadC [Motiliproteus sp. SC1-56]|uniref:RadC family protein n=1 Tax=Motiliproteus sp. SC1-56 TaxID=2799565 RepID=UPI001A8F2C70|nr:DNA repair protein RadC [Motiliproteus sp. SC1-56]